MYVFNGNVNCISLNIKSNTSVFASHVASATRQTDRLVREGYRPLVLDFEVLHQPNLGII